MTMHTYDHEERHLTRNTNTKLRVRSLAFAVGVATGFAYLLCILFIALAPQAAMRFFSYILHADLSGIMRTVNLGSFVAGLLFWSIAPALFAALIARFYNSFSTR